MPSHEPYGDNSKVQANDHINLNAVKGLTSTEVEEKQKQYGRNEVAERQPSSIAAFAKKFWGLAPWMLESAIVLSFVLGKYLDVYIIAALLLVNAVLGFIQEQQATRAVKALRQKLRLQARVLRDSVWQTVNAAEIVPGDVIRVRLGDLVPADFKILDAEASVDQSAITGESLPRDKKTGDNESDNEQNLARSENILKFATETHVHQMYQSEGGDCGNARRRFIDPREGGLHIVTEGDCRQRDWSAEARHYGSASR